VKAICMVESVCDEYAMRYEPSYEWLVGDEMVLTATERTGQMISWGLMQVMGGVARSYGFKGPFPRLCDPLTGVKFGLMHLKKFYAKYGNWQDAIASYNAGSPRTLQATGKYRNQVYVDKVLQYWAQFERQVPPMEIKT
jgi:hypothetical protein